MRRKMRGKLTKKQIADATPLVTLINKPLWNDEHNLLGHSKLNVHQMSGINHNVVMAIVQGARKQNSREFKEKE